jgi:diaminopimelate epimerase
VRSGACDGELTVAMPGGSLAVRVGPEFELVQEGPAEKVFEGEISDSGALLRC